MKTTKEIISKGEQSKRVILEAAKRLIAERGFNAITLQDVLDAAHVTKGKFFHHFSSKEELFSELLRFALTERGVLNFEEIVKQCPTKDPLAQLLFLLDQLIEWHNKGLPEEMRLCLFATFFFAPNSPEMIRINKILTANSKVLEKLISNSQKEARLPSTLDAEVFALLFPSASIGANLVGFLCGQQKLTSKSLIELRKIIVSLELPIKTKNKRI